MNMRKVIAAFLAAICLIMALPLGASAQGAGAVYAETSKSVQQGAYQYCYLYLDDISGLASLNVQLHYDPSVVTVVEHYNQVSAELYDASNQNGCLQYSYIFSGEDQSGQTSLFYFRYKISEDAPVGESYFDIIVTDALSPELETLDITGSRCKFTITEKKITQSCSIYGSNRVSTTVQQQFQLDYQFSTNAIASGAFVIEYDPELFAFEELICGGFLDHKVVDVNSDLPGAIYVSFVGTQYSSSRQLVSVKFRTIQNETTTAQIKLRVTELYDLELNSISCNGYTSTVNMTHDPSYVGDAPAMMLEASYDEDTEQVTLVIRLDADSHLGAGDFVLEFDENYLTFASAQKGFTPSFFNINDKQTAEGILKFSIISMTDIVEEETVLTVTFDVHSVKREQQVQFTITGGALTDSMTEPIAMNFVDTTVVIACKYISGDLNGDGKINSLDGLMLMRYLNGWTVNIASPEAMDVNGDGKVNSLDGLILMRYLNGWNVTLG